MKKYKNIYLIGLMGSGKTTLGKILSKKLDKHFYDSDQVIEEKLGVNVPMIFEYEGELDSVREKRNFERACEKTKYCFSNRGWHHRFESNRDLLAKNGIVIYLKSNQQDLVLRMKNDKTRPLLKNGNY
jgi:shikimate kinase